MTKKEKAKSGYNQEDATKMRGIIKKALKKATRSKGLKVKRNGIFSSKACRAVADGIADALALLLLLNARLHRLLQAIHRQMDQRSGAKVLRQLTRIHVIGNKFLLGGNVDPHVARIVQRWRGNSNVHLFRAAVFQQANQLANCGASNYRVIDKDYRLACSGKERVC